jgi:N-acyl-D-amino-acid deacylase
MNEIRASKNGNPICLMLLCALLLGGCEKESEPAVQVSVDDTVGGYLITNVQLIDGSGAPPRAGAVRVNGDEITDVGTLEPLEGERVIDGGGQVLAPGFIDTHSHAGDDLGEHPDAVPVVSQGITTIVSGQDGGSDYPLADSFARLEATPAAVNVASYAGHNTIRYAVMGDDYKRTATDAEVTQMESMLRQELAAGALGLAGGLEYDPGIYSEPEEMLRLARVTAEMGGRYIAHIRSEDRWFEQALDETIEIGRQTGMPVQISHVKLAMKSLWHRAPEFIDKLNRARSEGIDISADIYPYEYWQSNLLVLLPKRDITDREEATFALTEIAPADGVWMSRYAPEPSYVGKTLPEVAELRDTDPVTAFMQLLAESDEWEKEHGGSADGIIARSMIEEDILELLKWPHTNVCTDGGIVDLHPRARGAYPRILGRYVRELKALSLEDAVHKMTGLAAQHMGFTDRGLLEPGMAADLVLFDPATVIDHATPEDPEALSTGITTVWVNGVEVWNGAEPTGARPGRVIRRPVLGAAPSDPR